MNNALLLVAASLLMAGLWLGIIMLRYAKTGNFLDPINYYLINLALYFMFQVPFVLVPGNLYMVGLSYHELWPEIWSCFAMETAYCLLAVGIFLLLSSSWVKRDLGVYPRKVIAAASLLFQAHRLYLIFLVPVTLILVYFVAKFGAAMLLVDELGPAKARTVILREGAHFRALFNFASMALSTLLFYLCMLSVKYFQERKVLVFLGVIALFSVGVVGSFIITGTRTFAIDPILGLVTATLMFTPRHNKPAKVLGAGLFLILAASLMDALRSGTLDLNLFNIFYKGNSFADFRDFVWSYKNFHDKALEFWGGNSYFASWISFIPASLMPFREEWAYGRAIMRVVGWSSDDHFGIRSGLTGAIYFNGGLALVLVVGAVQGASLHLQQAVFRILAGSGGSLFGKLMMLFITGKLLNLTFAFLDNKSLWVLYVNIVILVGCFLLYPVVRLGTRVGNSAARAEFPARGEAAFSGSGTAPPPASAPAPRAGGT